MSALKVLLVSLACCFVHSFPESQEPRERRLPLIPLDSESWQFTVLLSSVAAHFYSPPSPTNSKCDHSSFQAPLLATKLY